MSSISRKNFVRHQLLLIRTRDYGVLRNRLCESLFHVTQNIAWLCKQRIAPLRQFEMGGITHNPAKHAISLYAMIF